MNATEPHPDDMSLLARLADIAGVVDPVPEEVVESGKAAFRLYRRDVDVMAMVSEVDLAAVRAGQPTSRMHFFELGTATLDVEVTTRDAFCRVVGVVTDTSGVMVDSVTLETTSATFTTEPDEDGRFEFVRVPVGLVRVTLARVGRDRPLATQWFEAS